jgi:hypothetical protein
MSIERSVTELFAERGTKAVAGRLNYYLGLNVQLREQKYPVDDQFLLAQVLAKVGKESQEIDVFCYANSQNLEFRNPPDEKLSPFYDKAKTSADLYDSDTEILHTFNFQLRYTYADCSSRSGY